MSSEASKTPKLSQEQLASLRDLEQELHELVKRKKTIDKSLATLENSIYSFESSYLEDTRFGGGNVVRGFDGYMNTRSAAPSFVSGASAAGSNTGRAPKATDRDRVFSHSSTTFLKAIGYSEEDIQREMPLLYHNSRIVVNPDARATERHQQPASLVLRISAPAGLPAANDVVRMPVDDAAAEAGAGTGDTGAPSTATPSTATNAVEGAELQ